MSRRHYGLPPMTTLVAFEAAARNGSFKTAADELNVTPGAVSHQIKALEGELNAELFTRVHRGVALTEDGRDLYVVLQTSFMAVSKALQGIKQTEGGNAITIGATSAVSSLWLTPRITRFWREYPDIRINQIVTDGATLPGRRPDLTLFYGNDRERGPNGRELFRDSLVPMGSPAFCAANAADEIGQLADLPLIHMSADDRRWTTWKTWFSECGYSGSIRRGTVVNNYLIALQAAQDGVGLVLGWKRLVAPLLESGVLEIFSEFERPAPHGFHIAIDDAKAGDPKIDLLENWLVTHE